MTIGYADQNELDLDNARVKLNKARAEVKMMEAQVDLVKAQADAIRSGKQQVCAICVEVIERINMDDPAPLRYNYQIPRCNAAPVLYSKDN